MTRIVALLTFSLFTSALFAQPSLPLIPIIDSIPMRDGKKLPCNIYLPASWTNGPVILIQTPYNRNAFNAGMPLGIGLNLNASNYAFCVVDWRGFWGASAMDYNGNPTRGEDGYDCVEWIATQTWSNDTVGTWGPSALGKCQYQTAKEYPPHLTCICPLVASPQFEYETYFPGGCYRPEYIDQLDALGYGMSLFLLQYPIHSPVWTFFAENPNWYPDSIPVPSLMIGGWYDHEPDEMIEFFNAIRTQSPVASEHRLLMGPWCHGGNSTAYVGSAQQGELTYNNAAGWNDSLALMFFDYYLRNISNGWNNTPVVQYYTMGSNAWNNSSVWPPLAMTPVTLYMHTDTTMDLMMPSSASGSIFYNYDPNDPSPTVGGPTLRQDLDQGPFDQTDSVESRNDILTFTTAPLTQDATISGVITVHLEVSSDKFDTDFCVRLCDVYPTGESMLVSDGVYRMRFRDGFDAVDTNIMVPNQHYFIDIELPNTSITFLQGHSMRIDVTSSNYPRFNRNMNTGQAMYPGPVQTAGDTLINPQIANNTIYTNSVYASRVTFPALNWPTGVAENTTPQFEVYPNPASEYIDVTNTTNETCKYSMFDATGRVVRQQQSNTQTTRIMLDGLAAGVYVLQMQSETGLSSREIIVQ